MKKLFRSFDKTWFFCFFISFLFLAIATQSSFFYYINEWMDANCFFTIGKSMLHHKIYYLDLFDQKGPLLYFYHTIAALISYRSFLGVYVIEVISFSFFLYYVYRLLRLFLSKMTSLCSLPIISFFILSLNAFSHGDSAEEFCLPFLMFSLYSLVSFFKDEKIVPKYPWFFIHGIMAGLVFTIKYTLVGFWFGFMMCMFFYLLKQKEVRRAFVSSFVFLLGMFLPILPWIIYFLVNGAFSEFIFSYFTFNIFLYPSQDGILKRLLMVIGKPIVFMVQNLEIGIFFFIGFLGMYFDKKLFSKKEAPIILSVIFFCLTLGVFIGGVSFRYYYLILTPFIIFGFVILARMIENYYHFGIEKTNFSLIMGIILLFLTFTVISSNNVSSMKFFVDKSDLVQYQFAEIINKRENPTILNYHFLDGGFYTTTGTIPPIRYYQRQNIPDGVFKEMGEEQERAIQNGEVDFVVTRKKISSLDRFKFSPFLSKNYHEVSKKEVNYEGKRFEYVLWEKN